MLYEQGAFLLLVSRGTRCYDPAVGRWLNADDSLYHSILGYNMYAYCNNNPVNYFDPTGQSAEALLSGWASSMWWMQLADGPIPVGDAAYWGGLLILGVAALGIWFADAVSN